MSFFHVLTVCTTIQVFLVFSVTTRHRVIDSNISLTPDSTQLLSLIKIDKVKSALNHISIYSPTGPQSVLFSICQMPTSHCPEHSVQTLVKILQLLPRYLFRPIMRVNPICFH